MGKTGSARTSKRATQGGKGRTLWRYTGVIVAVAVLAFGLRVCVLQGYRAPSRSMEDTLRVGDCLLIDKLTFGAQLPFGAGRLPAWRCRRARRRETHQTHGADPTMRRPMRRPP